MKVMNEKYQQALDIIKHAHPVSSEVKDIEELYPNEIDTLQELVDMMKPLTIDDFENMKECEFFYDKEIKMLLPFHGIDGGTMDIFVSFDKSMKVVFEPNRFYRNIWEVE